jgi:hypothetical protein
MKLPPQTVKIRWTPRGIANPVLQAFVLGPGGSLGENLLAGKRITNLEHAKSIVRSKVGEVREWLVYE